MRTLTILLALLMTTSGLAAMGVTAQTPVDGTLGAATTLGDEAVTFAECVESGADPATCAPPNPMLVADALVADITAAGDWATAQVNMICASQAGPDGEDVSTCEELVNAYIDSLEPVCSDAATCEEALNAACEEQADAATDCEGLIVENMPCDPRDEGACAQWLEDTSPIKQEDDGAGGLIITITTNPVTDETVVIHANAAQELLVITHNGVTIFDSNEDQIPDAGGENQLAPLQYTMTPCQGQVNTGGLAEQPDPWCIERLVSGIWLDIDSTPGEAGIDDSIQEDGALQSWARIRFDNDNATHEDFDPLAPERNATEDPHMRNSGALHIGPYICAWTNLDDTDLDNNPDPRCSSGNQYVDRVTGDDRDWDTLSEIHIKVPPNNDYARYFLHSDLDDDGFADIDELNCGSHPLHQESTCTDFDGDGLPNDAELLWVGGDVHANSDKPTLGTGDGQPDINDRDADNDGLLDGLEDPDWDGLLNILGPEWAPTQGSKPLGGDLWLLYPQTWREALDGDVLAAGDLDTVNADFRQWFNRYTNPQPETLDEKFAFVALGVQTDPSSRDTDGDDDLDWNSDPSKRDPHPRLDWLSFADLDGDGISDSCELKDGRTRELLGTLGETTDHTLDLDGDGLDTIADCAASGNPWDYDTDNDGLDDWEEVNGQLKDTTGLAPGALSTFSPTKPTSAHSDHTDAKSMGGRGDGIPDGVEVFGDWNSDSLAGRSALKSDCLVGCDVLDLDTDPIEPPLLDARVLSDRLTNDVLLQACAQQVNNITELGLTCEQTAGVWGITGIDREALLPVATDPRSVDSDDDGLWDHEEVQGFWNIQRSHVSSSNTGTSGWRMGHANAKAFLPSDPTVKDTDGDGVDDGIEVKDSTTHNGDDGPVNCHDNAHGTSGATHDCDGGYDTEPRLVDTDADGLTDAVERSDAMFIQGGEVACEPTGITLIIVFCGEEAGGYPDPRAWDTDGDGLGDGYEARDTQLRAGPPEAPFDPFNDTVRYCETCDGGFGTSWMVADTDEDDRNDFAEVTGIDDPAADPIEKNDPSDPAVPDTDGDGLLDGVEIGFGISPAVPDSDDDGLTDGQEIRHTTAGGEDVCFDPLLIEDVIDDETDASGLGRPFETCDGGYGTDPAKNDTDGDTFDDGLEIIEGTDPLDPLDFPDGDIDNDGLNDDWEKKYFGTIAAQNDEGDPDLDGFTNLEEEATADGDDETPESDPTDARSTPEDRDADGLPFEWEDEKFTGEQFHGPDDDPDLDELDNEGELEAETEPLVADTDGDGLKDGQEVNDIGSDPLEVDTDGDGLTDGEEVNGTHNPWVGSTKTDGSEPGDPTDPLATDSDFDLLTDAEETIGVDGAEPTGTNPNSNDSDNDGYGDGIEAFAGNDPLNETDSPGGDGVGLGRIPNPASVLTNRDCNFATPLGPEDPWDIDSTEPGKSGLWDGEECNDTSVETLLGPTLTDILTLLAQIQGIVDDADPNEPVQEMAELAVAVQAIVGEAVGDAIAETRVTDQNDPRDLDADGNTHEPNGQVDQIERNFLYVDRDDDNFGGRDVNKFSGTDGLTIVFIGTGFGGVLGPMPDSKHTVIRIGDVSWTADEEVFVFETSNGAYTYCQLADGSRFLVNGNFEKHGCSRYDATNSDGERDAALSADLSDPDMDGLPNDIYRRQATSGALMAANVHFRDNCPSTFNPDQADSDGNGVGDACEADPDGDGVLGASDNCPADANPGQADTDDDGVGDACDDDIDDDGVPNDVESGAGSDPEDPDSTPVPSLGDADGDGVSDETDNCPVTPNGDGQGADLDADGMGDACDPDRDGDGFADAVEDAGGSDPSDGESTPASMLDANGNHMPDEVEFLFAPSCYDWAGEPLYFCHHNENMGPGKAAFGDSWQGYAIMVFGVVVPL